MVNKGKNMSRLELVQHINANVLKDKGELRFADDDETGLKIPVVDIQVSANQNTWEEKKRLRASVAALLDEYRSKLGITGLAVNFVVSH